MSMFDREAGAMRCADKQLGGAINVVGAAPAARSASRRVPDVVDPVTGVSRKPTALERRRYREHGSHTNQKQKGPEAAKPPRTPGSREAGEPGPP